MKQKRTFLLLSLVLSTLAMAVAYAAIQDIDFSVTGNATSIPYQENFKVALTGTPTYSGIGTADLAITGATTATMNISGLKSVGDKLEATFTIVNTSAGLFADLSSSVTNSNPTYFKVNSVVGSSQISPKTSTTLTVTVELIKSPITEDQAVDLTVNVTASPVEVN